MRHRRLRIVRMTSKPLIVADAVGSVLNPRVGFISRVTWGGRAAAVWSRRSPAVDNTPEYFCPPNRGRARWEIMLELSGHDEFFSVK
jgi:hypothetical protein